MSDSQTIAAETAPAVASTNADAAPSTNGAAATGKSILANVKTAALNAKGAVTSAAITAKNKVAGIFSKASSSASPSQETPATADGGTSDEKK